MVMSTQVFLVFPPLTFCSNYVNYLFKDMLPSPGKNIFDVFFLSTLVSLSVRKYIDLMIHVLYTLRYLVFMIVFELVFRFHFLKVW